MTKHTCDLVHYLTKWKSDLEHRAGKADALFPLCCEISIRVKIELLNILIIISHAIEDPELKLGQLG